MEVIDLSLEKGTVLNNIYRVDKLLGSGAMGNVYLVERLTDTGRFVVKEIFPPEAMSLEPDNAREIFFREAEIMARFSHPGLPGMHGVFSHDGRNYITMDYIEGETLEEIMNSSKEPMSVKKAVSLIIEIADIMSYLHNSFETPVIYRDLKPSNIIITPKGNAKVIDFGIARYYTPGKNTDTFRFGTPGYAAPEQHKNRGQSGPQTDIFGLGVILYQMLTKYDPTVTPFRFPPMKPLNPLVKGDLEFIIRKAIHMDHSKRYADMEDFRSELEEYLSDSGCFVPRLGLVPVTHDPFLKSEENTKILIRIAIVGGSIFFSFLIIIAMFIQSVSNKSGSFYSRGKALYNDKKYEDSIRYFDGALRADSDNIDVWLLKGLALYELKRFSEAMKCFDNVLALEPDNIDGWNYRGLVFNATGKGYEGSKCFDKSLYINPKDVFAMSYKGVSLESDGRSEEAIQTCLKALSLKPNDVTALNNLGWVYLHQQKYDKADEYFNKVLALDPDNDYARKCVSSAIKPSATEQADLAMEGSRLIREDRFEEAIAVFDKVLAINPSYTRVLNDKAYCLYKLKRYDEATDLINQAIQSEPGSPIPWDTMGEILEAKEDYMGARICYEKCLKLDPYFSHARTRSEAILKIQSERK
ncbi:MAG: tetratricopeptide repeat protein [Candidatus Eremiobacterota bacterium]